MRQKYVTYKWVIAKTVFWSLILGLTTALIYGWYLKQQSIEDLARIDARKTSRMAFEALYSAMEKGWSKDELDAIIQRLNNVEPQMTINAYRNENVAKLFGDRPKDAQARHNDPLIQRAMGGIDTLVTDEKVRYIYPIAVKPECLGCHTNAKVGDINGVIDVTFPINNLRVSLSTIFNAFVIFFISFVILIFGILYYRLNTLIVTPLQEFIDMIKHIINDNDIDRRVSLKTDIFEVKNIEGFFNKMLDSLQDYYEKLQEISEKDYLTGLFNRRKFESLLEFEISRATRHNRHFSVVMIDLDNFKYINDTYGHAIGDFVLKEVAHVLSQHTRQADILARIGGDEFALILPETPLEKGHLVVSKLQHYLSHTPLSVIHENVTVTASFGLAEFPTHGQTLMGMMTGSDVAMYRAKKAGKNAIATSDINDLEMSSEIQRKGEFIRHALDDNRIEPFIQPIYELSTGKVFGYEVLARVRNDHAFIAAGQFIEVAEKLGLATDIDRTIMTKGLDLREKLDMGSKRLFFNVSLSSLSNETFLEQMLLLAQGEVTKEGQCCVVFELLEREAIPNVAQVMTTLNRLKSHHIAFALDDFGSGFSSFVYLKYFDTEFVKIDGEFIKNIAVNEKDRLFVKHINDICHEFGKKTIAEYVEDEETLMLLKEMGVDYAQGYHLGRPTRMELIG